MERLAIVILNWNGVEFLQRFLGGVVQHSRSAHCQTEVVVADNASDDDSLEYVREAHPTVRLIPLDQNYGFTGGYNRALAQIEADYYLLLNSDVEVSEGWIDPLVERMQTAPQVAALMPKIRSWSHPDRFEYAGACGGFIDALGYPFCRGRLIAGTETDHGQYDTLREVFWATGAAMLVRAPLYHATGELDEAFFAHMEEIDLCWRLKRQGYRIEVEPRSVVYHVGAGTLPVWSPRKTYLNFRNNLAMLYKNLAMWRFFLLLPVRIATDSLRLLSYLLQGKGSFAAAIFRGHRDFWRMRPRLDRQPQYGFGRVGQIYPGSIMLRYLIGRHTFGRMMALAMGVLLFCGCPSGRQAGQASSASAARQPRPAPQVVYPSVVNAYPHDPRAYTQGLLFHDGKLYESTGEYGRSDVRRVDPVSGQVEQKTPLANRYFGEGLALLDGKLYQLTWQEQRCFVYDLALRQQSMLSYTGEGWGIATDGRWLYVSDGSHRIVRYNPSDFSRDSVIEVYDDRGRVELLNELEWIDGTLWANLYGTNRIAVIDPATGSVLKYIDCAALESRIAITPDVDVFNGIAYDSTNRRIFVTGKRWDRLFEINIE